MLGARYMSIVVILLMAASAWSAAAQTPEYDFDRDTDLALGAMGVGLFGLGYWADQAYEPLTPEDIDALDPAGLNGLDRTAVDNWSPGANRASDYTKIASVAAPLALMFSEPGRDQADVIGLMYLETHLINGGLTYLLKNVFGRSRPFVYNDNPDIPQSLKMSHTAQRSFPSGHTSSAFASLVFLATVHSRLHPGSSANDWIWGGCLAAAATTGYLRYSAGMHFPTDIIAGATIGAFAGWVVPELHELESASPDGEQKSRRGGQTVIGFSLGF